MMFLHKSLSSRIGIAPNCWIHIRTNLRVDTLLNHSGPLCLPERNMGYFLHMLPFLHLNKLNNGFLWEQWCVLTQTVCEKEAKKRVFRQEVIGRKGYLFIVDADLCLVH